LRDLNKRLEQELQLRSRVVVGLARTSQPTREGERGGSKAVRIRRFI